MVSLFDQQEIKKEVHAIESLKSSKLLRDLELTSIFYYSNLVHIEIQ